MNASEGVKVREVTAGARGSAFRAYRALNYGNASLGTCLKAEVIQALFGGWPGAAGLFLRARTYRWLFPAVGRGVVFGRHVTLRHPHKIRLGDGVVVDDGAVLDAKGTTNDGIRIGNGVYIGRRSIVYCKNGDIVLEDGVNVSSHCQIFSSNRLVLRRGTVVGSFSYLLSGGTYDPSDPRPFAAQDGTASTGPLEIGPDAWLAAHVTVVDGAGIGRRCVIGAGAVVTRPVPDHSLAVGVPARVVRRLPDAPPAEGA